MATRRLHRSTPRSAGASYALLYATIVSSTRSSLEDPVWVRNMRRWIAGSLAAGEIGPNEAAYLHNLLTGRLQLAGQQ